MSRLDCGAARELIPDLAAERLAEPVAGEVEAHVVTCDECSGELELARLVFDARIRAPEGLSARVADAVRYDRRSVHRPWWGLTAAAVAALALGIGFATGDPGPRDSVPAYAFEIGEEDIWIEGDGLIAGAPSLDDLSDEDLARLLDELAVGGSGGAA